MDDLFGLKIKLDTGNIANTVGFINKDASLFLYDIFNKIDYDIPKTIPINLGIVSFEVGSYNIGIKKVGEDGENPNLYHVIFLTY